MWQSEDGLQIAMAKISQNWRLLLATTASQSRSIMSSMGLWHPSLPRSASPKTTFVGQSETIHTYLQHQCTKLSLGRPMAADMTSKLAPRFFTAPTGRSKLWTAGSLSPRHQASIFERNVVVCRCLASQIGIPKAYMLS
jgi:hypothetical protein